MSHTHLFILFAGGILILGSLIASRFVSRFGIPSLLAILAVGLLFGNGGRFDFDYDHPALTLQISEMALSIILFAGGFESNWNKSRPVKWQGGSLATLGVLATMVVVAVVTHWLLNWSWLQALLLGAVVSSTDAAAVFSIMENSRLKLKNGVREVLELESGMNDPMAFFLTGSLCALLLSTDKSFGAFDLVLDFVITMGVGLLTGWLAGKFILLFIRKINLKRGQYPVVLMACLLILYALNHFMGGSAFLAMYIAGIVIGNAPWTQRDISLHFFEGLSWLMETSLFLILGLQVYTFELMDVFWEGLFIALLLIFIARPAGVFVSMAFFKDLAWRTKAFYSWVGLRGATPIVFALIPVVMKVPDAHKIFNISFVVVVASMMLQGTTVARAAVWCDVKLKGLAKDPFET